MRNNADAHDERLLYRIARAYYEDNLTQQQIAGRFGLSRVKVSRLLGRAREAGIVQISITAPPSSDADLERRIESRFDLKEAVVVRAPAGNSHDVVSELGPAVATYLTRCLQGDETVAVSWGSTLLSVVDCLPALSMPDVRIVQMIGGLGEVEARVHGAELTRRMAQKLGARPRLLHAPGVVRDSVVRDALVNDPQVSGTLALAAKADIAVVGIGTLNSDSTLVTSNVLSEQEIEKLGAAGAVGDIALRFFRDDGKAIETPVDLRIVGLDIESIRKIPRVIGVAGGTDKVEVIQGALLGGFIDVLITDHEAASSLATDQQRAKHREGAIR